LVFLSEVGKDADGSFGIVDGTCFNDSEGEILSAEKRPAESFASFALLLRPPGSTPRKRAITVKGYYFAAYRAIKRSVPEKRNSADSSRACLRKL